MASPSAGSDKLSRLNDDVLHHILSFVPGTEHKARTSVICRRFRHLWAEHGTISIGLTSDTMSPDRYCWSVDCIISSFRSPALQSLELCIHDGLAFASPADRLICFAAARSVRNLSITSDRNVRIPRAILACTNLRSLYVKACTIGPMPNDFSGFPFLASVIIYLSAVTDDNLASLLGNCPALRSLCLRYCNSLSVLDVTSSTLVELTVCGCEGLKSVRVDAPSLAYVSFEGDADGLFLKNVARLSGVRVYHTGGADESVPAGRAEWERKVMDLCLASKRMQMDGWLFRFVLPTRPVRSFENLKKLTCRVEWVTADMLRGLVAILEHSPNLEHLHINLWCGTRKVVPLLKEVQMQWLNLVQDDRECQVWDPPKSGDERFWALKSVVVKGFMATANEMKMVEYLLLRGVVLEKFTLAKCLPVTDTDRESLACFPRASPRVQIQICPVEEIYSFIAD